MVRTFPPPEPVEQIYRRDTRRMQQFWRSIFDRLHLSAQTELKNRPRAAIERQHRLAQMGIAGTSVPRQENETSLSAQGQGNRRPLSTLNNENPRPVSVQRQGYEATVSARRQINYLRDYEDVESDYREENERRLYELRQQNERLSSALRITGRCHRGHPPAHSQVDSRPGSAQTPENSTATAAHRQQNERPGSIPMQENETPRSSRGRENERPCSVHRQQNGIPYSVLMQELLRPPINGPNLVRAMTNYIRNLPPPINGLAELTLSQPEPARILGLAYLHDREMRERFLRRRLDVLEMEREMLRILNLPPDHRLDYDPPPISFTFTRAFEECLAGNCKDIFWC